MPVVQKRVFNLYRSTWRKHPSKTPTRTLLFLLSNSRYRNVFVSASVQLITKRLPLLYLSPYRCCQLGLWCDWHCERRIEPIPYKMPEIKIRELHRLTTQRNFEDSLYPILLHVRPHFLLVGICEHPKFRLEKNMEM